MSKGKRLADILTHLVLTAVLLVTVFPLIYTIFASFKTNAEIMANPAAIFPTHPTFQNYIDALHSETFDVKRMTFNSTYYTIVVVAFTILSSALGGYVFARGEFRGKSFWLAAFSLLMFFSMGSVTIYPTLKILNFLHVPKSLPGLMLTKIFGVSIVNIYQLCVFASVRNRGSCRN